MGSPMRFTIGALVLGLHTSFCFAADVPALIQQIKAVGPEAANAADTARAWREFRRVPGSEVPQMLAAIDGASPVAANWLRMAVDAIAERERAIGRVLPAAALESFLHETHHAGRGRRLAYELLCSADPTAPARLLPT